MRKIENERTETLNVNGPKSHMKNRRSMLKWRDIQKMRPKVDWMFVPVGKKMHPLFSITIPANGSWDFKSYDDAGMFFAICATTFTTEQLTELAHDIIVSVKNAEREQNSPLNWHIVAKSDRRAKKT